MEVKQLIKRYPLLYHMAEPGAWPSIRQHGLMSTTAALARLNIPLEERRTIDGVQRPKKVTIRSPQGLQIVLRDQKPMPEDRLRRAMDGSMTPQQWYELINSRVFFWVSRARLETLLCAVSYRNDEHDVLTIDSESLVRSHEGAIMLCHMNSGNTFPMPHIRGRDTFRSIADYPTKANGSPAKEVVELTVANEVLDIEKFVLRVQRMKGGHVINELPR